MSLLVDERDVRFVLFDQLRIDELTKTETFREHSDEVFQMVLTEAHRLAENVLAPANVEGDRVGARYEDGKVILPESFHACYQAACEGGWICPSDDMEVGGQGLPTSLCTAAYEIFFAANCAFTLHPTLNHGAGKLVEKHGTDEQKALYLEKLYTGQWAGTMCLTEPGAGSDLGVLKTKAIRNPDGTFQIQGTKQFITAGEHDLTENIIHPVLARIEGDPLGSKGISLFLVPKIRVNPDGSLGEANDVACAGIEHKMGIKGSATCTLYFGENGNCVGELLGGERQGLPIMFIMMNEERLNVGLQGQGIASTAYLCALKFARERMQGQAMTAGRGATDQVAIIEHPDVRRMLIWMKAYVEGLRALMYYTGYCIDRERAAEDEEEKRYWTVLAELLTPICKAYGSDMAYDVCEQAIQVHGGYGFCSEYPVEQFTRDCKIASIYEGTNGIQAMDLLNRKILRDKGAGVKALLGEMMPVVERNRSHAVLGPYAATVEKSYGRLQEALTHVTSVVAGGEIEAGFLESVPLLEIFGDVMLGWFHLWQAEVALRKLEKLYGSAGANTGEERAALVQKNPDAAYLEGKVSTAKYYIGRLLPIVGGKVEAIKQKETAPLDIPDAAF
jgi:alkylation response protein AidB-like acyl-CoA dehydrogenase